MRRSILVVGVAILGLALLAPAAWAEPACLKVEGTLQTSQSVPLGPFEGQAWLTIGDNFFHADLTSVLTSVRFTDGTIHNTVRLTYDFGNGDTFTLDNASVITPTLGEPTPGVLGLHVKGRIAEGTGRFAEAFGRFVTHGTISFVAGLGQTDQEIKGVVCDSAE